MIGQDFLDNRPAPSTEDYSDFIEKELELLRQIRDAARKLHPDRRCVVQLEFNNGQRILTRGTDICHAFFTVDGRNVKSHYLIVANASDQNITITLNEAIQKGVSAADANGIPLGSVGSGVSSFITIEAEIEFIELAIRGTATGQAIQVNNSATAVPAQGNLTVYAFVADNLGGR